MTPDSSRSGTLSAIAPILHATYGETEWTDALAVHLANKIDAYDGVNRAQMILTTCWDWMTGGTTAASTARKIEEALSA